MRVQRDGSSRSGFALRGMNRNEEVQESRINIAS